MPIFYYLIINVNGNESRNSVLVNLPRYPDLAIVCVQDIKDRDEPEEAVLRTPAAFFDASESWVASVSWSGSYAAGAELLPRCYIILSL